MDFIIKTVTWLTIATLFLVTATSSCPVSNTTTNVTISDSSAEPNISCPSAICFGLDNSIGLSEEQFSLQKRFVAAIIGRISKKTSGASFTIVSYGTANELLVPLTSNFSDVVDALSTFTYVGEERVFLGGPIVSCDSKLRDEPKQAKIALISSGLDNLGGDPVPRAEVFRQRSNGEIVVVSIGDEYKDNLETISNKTENFFELDEDWKCSEVVDIVDILCR